MFGFGNEKDQQGTKSQQPQQTSEQQAVEPATPEQPPQEQDQQAVEPAAAPAHTDESASITESVTPVAALADVVGSTGTVLRTYTREEHGEDFAALAGKFSQQYEGSKVVLR